MWFKIQIWIHKIFPKFYNCYFNQFALNLIINLLLIRKKIKITKAVQAHQKHPIKIQSMTCVISHRPSSYRWCLSPTYLHRALDEVHNKHNSILDPMYDFVRNLYLTHQLTQLFGATYLWFREGRHLVVRELGCKVQPFSLLWLYHSLIYKLSATQLQHIVYSMDDHLLGTGQYLWWTMASNYLSSPPCSWRFVWSSPWCLWICHMYRS